MASVVTSTGQGEQFITLDKCVAFKITGGYSERPNKTVILYQLCKEGEPITDIKDLELCQAGEEVEIDFTRDVEKCLTTSMPDCANATTIAKDDTASATFQLKLGEIMINNDTCMEDMDPIDLEAQMSVAEEIVVVNGYCNPGETVKGDSSGIIMTNRPDRYVQCFCQKDWIYVFGSFQITATAFDTSGDQIPGAFWNGGSSPADCVSMIPAGTHQLAQLTSASSNVGYYRLNISGYIYKIHTRKCCCKPECKIDIYALEPKGGFALVSALNCIESITTDKTGEQLCIEKSCFGTAEENAKAGYKWLQDESFVLITARADVKIPPAMIYFMIGVASSAAYAVRLPCTDLITNFLVGNNQMQVFTKKGKTPVTITGGYPLQTHSFN